MGEPYTNGNSEDKEIRARMLMLEDEMAILMKQRDELYELLQTEMDAPGLDYSQRDAMRARVESSSKSLTEV